MSDWTGAQNYTNLKNGLDIEMHNFHQGAFTDQNL